MSELREARQAESNAEGRRDISGVRGMRNADWFFKRHAARGTEKGGEASQEAVVLGEGEEVGEDDSQGKEVRYMPTNVIVINGAFSYEIPDSKMEALLGHLDALAKRKPLHAEEATKVETKQWGVREELNKVISELLGIRTQIEYWEYQICGHARRLAQTEKG